jgi:hypothetical protein
MDKFFIPNLHNGSFKAQEMLFRWKLHLYSLDTAVMSDVVKPAMLHVSVRGIQSMLFCLHALAHSSLRGIVTVNSGPGSSVGIATDYGRDGPGIESRWGARFTAPVQTSPEAHAASCTMGTRSFLGVKCGWWVLLTTRPLLVPRSWKSRVIPLPTLWATPGL